MKVTWEKSDIRAGQHLFRPTIRERWMIGYRMGTCEGEQDRYLIISLSDGGVSQSFSNATDLCGMLNDSQFLPIEVLPITTGSA